MATANVYSSCEINDKEALSENLNKIKSTEECKQWCILGRQVSYHYALVLKSTSIIKALSLSKSLHILNFDP